MLWKCDSCKTLYAVDLPYCPQCGATGHAEVDSGGQPLVPDRAAAAAAKAAEPAEPAAKAKPAAGGKPPADA